MQKNQTLSNVIVQCNFTCIFSALSETNCVVRHGFTKCLSPFMSRQLYLLECGGKLRTYHYDLITTSWTAQVGLFCCYKYIWHTFPWTVIIYHYLQIFNSALWGFLLNPIWSSRECISSDVKSYGWTMWCCCSSVTRPSDCMCCRFYSHCVL